LAEARQKRGLDSRRRFFVRGIGYKTKTLCQRSFIREPRRATGTRCCMRERVLTLRRIHQVTSRQVARYSFKVVAVHAKHLAGLTSCEAELRSRAARSFSTSIARAR